MNAVIRAPLSVPWTQLWAAVLMAALAGTCRTDPRGAASSVGWSRSVDSLLKDTARSSVELDSLRQAVITASSDTAALDAALALAAELPGPVGDPLITEARVLSRKKNYAYGAAEAEYRSARIAVRQYRLHDADSLLKRVEGYLGEQDRGRWAVLRIKLVYSRADLKRYAREPEAALAGFRQAMGMAQRISDHEWIAASEAALGATFLTDLKYDSARIHCLRCVEMAERAGDRDRMAACHNFLGEMYRLQENYDEAIKHQGEALHLAEGMKDRSRMAENLFALGEIFRQKDDFPRALDHYQRSLGLAEAMGMQQVAALNLLYMGDIHHGFGENDTALAQYARSEAITERAGIAYLRSLCLIHASRAHGELNDPAAGLLDALAALAIADSMNNHELLRNSHNVIGEMLQMQGKYDEAIAHYDTAIAMSRRNGTMDERFYAQQMGTIHRLKGDIGKAREMGELAMHFAEINNAGPLEVALAADLLHKVYRSIGEHEKAMDMLELKVAMNDSVFNARQLRKVSNLELKAQQEQMLATRERERAKEELAITAERSRRNLFAVAGLAVLVLSIGLWSRLRYMRRTRDTILRTQQQLVASEKQREAEQVRTRIARDVHDELGSELTRITLLVGEGRRDRTEGASAERMDRIAALTREVSSSLSDIVWAVDPRHDSVESLVAHAQHYTERMLENTPMRVEQHFSHTGPDRPLDPATKRNVFLLLKEALNNALKYSKAAHVSVGLGTTADRFTLFVRDDGIGFDPVQASTEGNGLANMQARCTALGATLLVNSAPGRGCTIEVSGPLG